MDGHSGKEFRTGDKVKEKLPKRKPTRLKYVDYSTPGVYFITICTKGRKQLLSEIIVGDGVPYEF